MKTIFKLFVCLILTNACFASEESSKETVTDIAFLTKIEQTRAAAHAYVNEQIKKDLAAKAEREQNLQNNDESVSEDKK